MNAIQRLISLLIFSIVTLAWAEAPNDKMEEDPEIRKFLDEFFGKAIFSRDARFLNEYFASEAEFLSLRKAEDLPNGLKRDNYEVAKKGFNEDCIWIMDLLPKVDVKSFTKLECHKLEESIDPEKTQTGVEYKLKYSYEYSINKFEFITPTIVKFNGKPKFISRFWIPLRFTL